MDRLDHIIFKKELQQIYEIKDEAAKFRCMWAQKGERRSKYF